MVHNEGVPWHQSSSFPSIPFLKQFRRCWFRQYQVQLACELVPFRLNGKRPFCRWATWPAGASLDTIHTIIYLEASFCGVHRVPQEQRTSNLVRGYPHHLVLDIGKRQSKRCWFSEQKKNYNRVDLNRSDRNTYISVKGRPIKHLFNKATLWAFLAGVIWSLARGNGSSDFTGHLNTATGQF